MDATDTAGRQRARYREIDADECWELIGTAPVGRLVWHGGEGLSVATLNFSVDRRSIVFRTLAYGSIAHEVDDSPVAFQVDHVDETTRTGWSVLVRGHAHFDYDSASAHLVDT